MLEILKFVLKKSKWSISGHINVLSSKPFMMIANHETVEIREHTFNFWKLIQIKFVS